MAEGHVAHRASALAWLAPPAPRLAALAGDAGGADRDPASALLLVRFTRPSPAIHDATLTRDAFQQSSILEAAATFLESKVDAWANPAHSVVARLLAQANLIAEKAESLAAVANTCPPAAARLAGLLAPLGWLAVAAVEPECVDTCLQHRDFQREPGIVEDLVWGLSADAIARRLLHRWRLPAWLTNTLTTLRLPVNDAIRLGANAELTRVLRFAITATECQGASLGLLGPSTAIVNGDAPLQDETIPPCCGLTAADDPRATPLLPALLRSTATARRSAGGNRTAVLEAQIDQLQAALRNARKEFDVALRDAKLVAMAELAAGAGHEINNPLAVISGNAQLLRAREPDPDRRKSLDTIIRQTTRIAELLQDMMQFARPAKASPGPFAIRDLLAACERETSPIAALKSVSLRFAFDDGSRVTGDAQQVRKALGNLIRNSIDATPSGGMVRVYTRDRSDTVEIVVEDTGDGPPAEHQPHLFDPFFSGRVAGRGRGLGLSTAWQYARQNGGTLRYEPVNGGPTRFVLSLSKSDVVAERLSA